MNYYDETLAKAKQLVKEKNYQEALKIIEGELSLPYVPIEFETQLKELQSEIYQIVGKPKKPELNGAEIFALLNDSHASLDEKVGLFGQLEAINLRNFLTEVNEFIQSQNPNELKTILIYLLANQEIDHEFSYVVNGSEIKLNPKTFDFKKLETLVIQLNKILNQLLPKDYPQLVQMGQIVVANFYYKVFPIVENYELEKLAQAIRNRLLIVTGIEQVNSDDLQVQAYEKLLIELEIV